MFVINFETRGLMMKNIYGFWSSDSRLQKNADRQPYSRDGDRRKTFPSCSLNFFHFPQVLTKWAWRLRQRLAPERSHRRRDGRRRREGQSSRDCQGRGRERFWIERIRERGLPRPKWCPRYGERQQKPQRTAGEQSQGRDLLMWVRWDHLLGPPFMMQTILHCAICNL